MKYTKNKFAKLALSTCLFFQLINPYAVFAQSDNLISRSKDSRIVHVKNKKTLDQRCYDDAKKEATEFSNLLGEKSLDKINSLNLEYSIFFESNFLDMKTKVTMALEKDGEYYTSEFRLHDLEGEGSISKWIFDNIGRRTDDYKEHLENMSRRYVEKFLFYDSNFRTIFFKQTKEMDECKKPKEIMKVKFDYKNGKVRYSSEGTNIDINYTGELGPMTALMGYFTQGPAETKIHTINPNEKDGKKIFKSQTVEIESIRDEGMFGIEFLGEDSFINMVEAFTFAQICYNYSNVSHDKPNWKIPFYIKIPRLLDEKGKTRGKNVRIYLEKAVLE